MLKAELINKLVLKGYDGEAAEYVLEQLNKIKDIGFLKLLTSFIANKEQMGIAVSLFKKNVSLDKISVVYRKEFDSNQMNAGSVAIINGLTLEQLKYLYKVEFDHNQMRQCGLGFYNKLLQEQIEAYYSVEFNKDQMKQARWAFEIGLTMEQVLFFYKKEFTSSEMYNAIEGFECGLTIEQVSSYLKEENSYIQMRRGRIDLMKELGLDLLNPLGGKDFSEVSDLMSKLNMFN